MRGSRRVTVPSLIGRSRTGPRTAPQATQTYRDTRESLQRERQRLLEQLLDAREELRAVRAVEDAVVADQRQRQLVAGDDAARRRRPPASWRSAPTVRIAACGGLMIAVKCSTPYMPRFETVNVPPASSGGVICWSRTFSISRARVARRSAPSDLRVGVEDRRHDQRVLGGHGHADVDALVELQLAVAVGAVDARVLAQRQSRRP